MTKSSSPPAPHPSNVTAMLQALLGGDAIVSEDERGRYEIPYRGKPGRAAAVVRPRTTSEVSSLVRLAHANGFRLIAQGAHTGLVGAATPDENGQQVIVSLDRLRQINIVPEGRTAVCGAGALLSALNNAAEQHGLFLPIDLGADPSIGGMAATNTGGARLLRYGDMRRQVLGLEVVMIDAEGSVLSDLKGLRKNNTGIDLKQIFIGGNGQGGIITAVQIELQPRIAQSANALVIPADLDELPAIISTVERRMGSLLSACEGMSRSAMEAAFRAFPQLSRPLEVLPGYALLIEASTSIQPDLGVDVESLLMEALSPLLEGDSPLATDIVMGRGADFWELRHSISDSLKSLGKVIGMDIAVARECLPALRNELIARVEEAGGDVLICDFGHVGDGGMHFNLVCPHTTDGGTVDCLRSMIYEITVNQFGGTFSAEHGLGPANAQQIARFINPTRQRLQAAIRNLCDPAGLLGWAQ